MCDPLSLTIAATAVAAVGQGVSAVSSYQQGQYAAKVAEANAEAESRRAADAYDRGRIESQKYQRAHSQEQGQQVAALAANGIDVGFGSAFNVRADLAEAGRQDVQTIDENARREAMGFDINAANFTAEAVASRRQAKGALIQGAFGVASTVLGGATQYRRIQSGRAGGY